MAEIIGFGASVIAGIELFANISLLVNYYTDVKNAKDDVALLRRECIQSKTTLQHVQKLLDGPNAEKLKHSQELRDGVLDYLSQLSELESKLDPGKANKVMSQFGIRAFNWPFKRKEEVASIVKNLGRYREMISLNLQAIQVTLALDVHQEIFLSKLRPSEDAAFDSHADEHDARCHPDTRVDLRRQISEWADDPNGKCIFWLNGMAGTGKSTVSRTMAHNFANMGALGASFFFKRGEPDRGRAALLFPTIVAQLVQKLPSLAPHIRNAIEADPAITGKAMKEQFEKLVLQPIGKMARDRHSPSKIVIVLDALDECDREEDVKVVINLLSQAKHLTSVRLRFFVTSRPDLPIRLGFEDISGKFEGLVLHQIPKSIIEKDISAFLGYELARIRDDYNKSVSRDRQLPSDWPGEKNVQSLVTMAIPLFIFAATVCRFIKDRKCGDPEEQLTKVLTYQTRSQESKLDATYLPIVDQLLIGLTALEKRCMVEEFRDIVGSIVILAKPLSTASLSRLLGIPKRVIDRRIDLLHSVLSIPSNPDVPVRLFHLSFRDFLLDPEKREKREEIPFWVDEKKAHEKIAARCLHLMSTDDNLKRNICNLQLAGNVRTDVDKQTIDECLPPEVQNACLYWVYHSKKSNGTIRDGGQTHTFLKCHFLHWLEALSLIGRISESIGAIDDLQSIIDHINSSEVSAFLHDAKRFILNCRSAIDVSPLQIYSSAILFSPEKSVIRNVFKDQILERISLLPVDSDWSACLQTLEGHSGTVRSVAFSHDNTLLASASNDKTVRIWDAGTSVCLQTLKGHNDQVNSVAFSYDGTQIISASNDRTIKIWDAGIGVCTQTLDGHGDRVSSVVFTHNGRMAASGSGDKFVKIWDVGAGVCLQTLKGHTGPVMSIAFSFDGTQVASASYDRTIKVWDIDNSVCLKTLKGHSGSINSVAFSCDGTQIVSASNDRTIKIWDSLTSTCLLTLDGHSNWVSSVAFSYNGAHVASSSYDQTVKIWDAGTGVCLQTLNGHSGTVSAVTFSHDSTLLASASNDKTVRIWDSGTRACQQELDGHSDYVNSVAFSPDNTQLASASDDKTVKIWDSGTGVCLQTLEGHSDYVNSIAFSPDGTQLASASDDKTVKIWDSGTGVCLRTLKDHNGTVRSVSFSSDGTQVTSASHDCTVKIWNAGTGVCLRTIQGHSDYVNSVAFSHDGAHVASASDDRAVKIWDARTGECKQTINVDTALYDISFDTTGAYLYTELGALSVNVSSASNISPVATAHQKPRCHGYGFNADRAWITQDGQNLLWLPSLYRPCCSTVAASSVAIGCRSGRVFIIKFYQANV